MTQVYGTAGVKISSSTDNINSTGYRSFTLSGIANNQYAVVIGPYSTSSTEAMRATYSVHNVNSGGFVIHSIDTDNKNHNLYGCFIAILSY